MDTPIPNTDDLLHKAAERMRDIARDYLNKWNFPIRAYMCNGGLSKMVKGKLTPKQVRDWALRNGYITTGFTFSGAQYILPGDHNYTDDQIIELLWKLDNNMRMKRLPVGSDMHASDYQKQARKRRRKRKALFPIEVEDLEAVLEAMLKLTAKYAECVKQIKQKQLQQNTYHGETQPSKPLIKKRWNNRRKKPQQPQQPEGDSNAGF